MQMICPKCGTTNESGARFCANCGAPLATEKKDEAAESDSTPKQAAEPTLQPNSALGTQGAPAQEPASEATPEPEATPETASIPVPEAAPKAAATAKDWGAATKTKLAALGKKQKAVLAGVCAVAVVAIVAMALLMNAGPSESDVKALISESHATISAGSSRYSTPGDFNLKSVKILGKTKSDLGRNGVSLLGYNISEGWSVDLEVVYANNDAELTKRGNVYVVKANGDWAFISFSPSSLDTTGTKVTSGVDEEKLVSNISSVLSEASNNSTSLQKIYADGSFKIKKQQLDSEHGTDTVTIACKKSTAYSEAQGTVTATFSYGTSGWELKSARASKNAAKVSYQKLVGTWNGEFKQQWERSCFAGKANPLKVNITKVDESTGQIEGTFDCVAHNHARASNSEDSDAGDQVLTEQAFSMALPITSADTGTTYLSDDYERSQDASGTVTLTLTFGGEDGASAQVETDYEAGGLFNWADYNDCYTLTKAK